MVTPEVDQMNKADLLQVADAYQGELSRSKFEQETQRDKTLVLLAGGALTVSFAFISSLVEHSRLFPVRWLISAWTAWVLALVTTLAAYTLSIRVYNQVIGFLSRGQWSAARKTPKLAKYIEPLNIAACALVVWGFIGFGWFTIHARQSTRKLEYALHL